MARRRNEELATVFQFANRTFLVRAPPGAMLAAWLCWAVAASADNAPVPSARTLDAIVVTAKRRPDPVVDEKLTQQVAAALHSDPYFYDEHVTVTVKNGVVRLEGVVFDDSDVFDAVRIARRIAGVRRVVTDFYIPDGQ
ncbi:MAG: BON domain-containing protein [Steroidobacteraceae bacterium]